MSCLVCLSRLVFGVFVFFVFFAQGLTAVISVKVPEPEFEGQTKNRLGNPEVRGIVDAVVNEELVKVFEWHPKVLLYSCTYGCWP